MQYNSSISMLTDRINLDRRRLEDAHIIYAVLDVMRWYPTGFSEEDKILKPAHFNNILSHLTPTFHKCFSERYAGWYNNGIVILNIYIV